MGETSGKLSGPDDSDERQSAQEDPLKIISDIVVGMQKSGGKYLIEPDRAESHFAGHRERGQATSCCWPEGHRTTRFLRIGKRFILTIAKLARKALNDRGLQNENGK